MRLRDKFRSPAAEDAVRCAGGESAVKDANRQMPGSTGAAKGATLAIPDGMFEKCPACRRAVYTEDVQRNRFCCPRCGAYFRVGPWERIQMVTDSGSFAEWDADVTGGNPLDFPEYEEKKQRLREQTGLGEAVVTGEGRIRGCRAAIGVMAPDFMMGSMGTAVGERITRLIERAVSARLPVVLFCASGGARMQEGILSLMQMAKISQALRRHDEAGLLFLPVLTDPTMGGVTASFAMLGDVILAEPGAMIGFAGARVIRQTIGQKLPEGFQSAEFLQQHGFIDRIVKRDRLRSTLAFLLRSACAGGIKPNRAAGLASGIGADKASGRAGGIKPNRAAGCAGGIGANKANGRAGGIEPNGAAGLAGGIGADKASGRAGGIEPNGVAGCAGGSGNREENRMDTGNHAWEKVHIARSAARPAAADYISHIFDRFVELHGDRYFGDDRAVIGGIAELDGRYVTVIGQQKGRSAKENKYRNFGMPNPEGYRKALRLMRQAEKFGRPVVLFVDTPGAFCGVEAEERGQGEAIARNLFEMSGLHIPVISILIGEGGSGGALALAVANQVWMLEHAVYSVLSPEGFAAILWKDAKRAPEAAWVMKITAQDLKELGVIEEIIPEGRGTDGIVGADRGHMDLLAEYLKKKLVHVLAGYEGRSGEELVRERYRRFRKF